MRRRIVAIGAASAAGVAGLGFVMVSATAASASTTVDMRGSWAQVATTQGANYPQTVTWTSENFSTGALVGTDVGGGATFNETGTITGSKITTHLVEVGAAYTSDSVGTVKTSGGQRIWSGTFTDSAGHPQGTFTSTFIGPAGASSASPAASGLGAIPPACTTTITSNCSYNSRDGALTFTPSVAKVGDTIVAKMVSPAGVGNSWSWTDLPGLTAQNCAPSAVTCNYQTTALTGTTGARYVLGTIDGSSVQGPWTSAQAYAVAEASEISGGSGSSGKVIDVRGLWDGYYVQPGGAKFHNPVEIVTENLTTGALTGTDNGTDGAATVSGNISGRTINLTISQPSSGYNQPVTWILSADGKEWVAGGISDPNASGAFVLFRHGAPVGGASPLTSGTGVTSGPAPINALPTPAEAFSSPGRIIASAAISIAALLFITFPANLFNKTFEENYDVISAWWEPRLRRFRRKHPGTVEAAESNSDRTKFALVVIAGAIFGGLLNPKFGANSASVNSFIATLLAVLVGTIIGTAVGFAYRRRKKYDVTRHFEALPAGLAIAALCVVLSRISNFQPGYLYGVVCGVAFAGTLAKNESGHLVALGHLATIAVAVVAWFVWVPVNHAALHHPGVFPLVILDDLLASLFVGGLVGSVINLIPVRFMPGHTLASWHRGAWMAVFGVAAFGMTEIVLFPSRHNHAGHAPIITIIVLFVVFGGGSLWFREYFSRRERRLELAKHSATTEPAGPLPTIDAQRAQERPLDNNGPLPEPVPVPTPRAEPIDDQAAELAPRAHSADSSAPHSADSSAPHSADSSAPHSADSSAPHSADSSAPQNADPAAEIHRL